MFELHDNTLNFPSKEHFSVLLTPLSTVEHRVKITVKWMLTDFRLQYLSHVFKSHPQTISNMHFLGNSAHQMFPLTFSLLPVECQMFQFMNIEINHLVLHRSIFKFNTSLSEWIPQLTKNNFKVIWTMKDYRNKVPYLLRLNFDSFMEVIRVAMVTQHMQYLSKYLTYLKAKHVFESLSEYWTVFNPLHHLAASNYITLIRATKLDQQFPLMISFR